MLAASVIAIHGLGQSPAVWAPFITDSLRSQVNWVFPQAPDRRVSFNQGQFRPSWFDIHELPPRADETDELAMSTSVKTINDLVQTEIEKGIIPSRIFLMGFSQGAALSLTAAFATEQSLGGVIVLSGWVPHFIRHKLKHRSLPVFWCHGDNDSEIPLGYGEEAIQFLTKSLGVEELEYKRFPGLDHTIIESEIEDVMSWLQRRLN